MPQDVELLNSETTGMHTAQQCNYASRDGPRGCPEDPLATHKIKPRCMWVVTASMDVQVLRCSMYGMYMLPLLPQSSKLHVVPGHRADFQSHNNTDHTSPSTLAESEGVRGRSRTNFRNFVKIGREPFE